MQYYYFLLQLNYTIEKFYINLSACICGILKNLKSINNRYFIQADIVKPWFFIKVN